MLVKPMTRALPLMLVVLAVSACDTGRMPATLPPLPTTTVGPTVTYRAPRVLPTFTPTPGPDVDFDGVAFHFDPSLGVAQGVTVPPDDEGVGSTDWMLPSRALFTVSGYPIQHSSRTPLIAVFPVSAMAGFNDIGSEYVDSVRQLLEDQPASGDIEGAVPQVAVLDEDELLHAQVKYLDFKNGSGVRFIALYASDIRPVTNEDLVYIFQGITSDGSAFVTILMPISQADLYDTENGPTNSEIDGLLADFDGYLTDITKDLEIANDDTFKPSLSALDDLVQSFSVTLALEDVTPEPAE